MRKSVQSTIYGVANTVEFSTTPRSKRFAIGNRRDYFLTISFRFRSSCRRFSEPLETCFVIKSSPDVTFYYFPYRSAAAPRVHRVHARNYDVSTTQERCACSRFRGRPQSTPSACRR